MSLTIFKSSAGSGKTYTLAKEYLKLALRAPDYYKKILAVTFTNRAAEEMKERVLEFLVDISNGKHELIPVMSNELGKSEEEIQIKARETLEHLLHNYGYFNITTIDTFFHRVIRAFSREIGLQGSFSIELDDKKVTDFIASDLYDGVEENDQLKKWLVNFSMHRLGDGKGYEFKNEIKELASQLFSEEFKKLSHEQFDRPDVKERIAELQSNLLKSKFIFENTLKKIGQQFYEEVSESGLSLDDFSGGKKRTLPNFFNRLITKDFKTLLNKTVENARRDPEAWTAKSSAKRASILQLAIEKLIPLMNQALEYFEKNQQDYFTSRAVLKHLYTLGLLSDLTNRLQEYKKEEEIIMISDLPDFLNQIIDDSDAPFIYEKVGSRYSHFLIDEFQDTSIFQWKNFRPLLEESLANGNENIIVGDAKQSIYGFRGGDPSLLMSGIQKDISSAQPDDSNNTNYRSATNIVDFNNHLFSKLPELIGELAGDDINDKGREMLSTAYDAVEQMVAEHNQDSEGLVHVEFFKKEREESWHDISIDHTIQLIEKLQKEGHSLNDMAMLVRTNREASQIVRAILDHKRDHDTNIEVISADGMLISSSRVVRLILTAFNYLLNPKDNVVEKDLIFEYQQVVLGRKLNEHQDFASLGTGLLPEAFTKHQEHLLHLPIFELTEVLIRLFKLDEISDEFAYLQAFQDAILEFGKNKRSDIRLFMEWWKDEADSRSVQLTGALDAIEVITLHKSKGLQYSIVIVPFCTFSLDSRRHTSWYKSPEEKPFDLLDSIPIEYTSSLTKTRFLESYQDEVAKWYLESLNMLYVAFTRAERGLFAFCETPSSKSTSYGDMSKLLWAYFRQNQPDGWNENGTLYKKGTLSVEKAKVYDQHTSLTSYPTYKWSNRLTIRKTGAAYFDPEAEKKRREGILLHQILSEIKTKDEATEVLDRYEKSMQITTDDKGYFSKLFSELWELDMVGSWFEPGVDVKTEVVVLPKDGEVKRMDRVVIQGNNATVVDFKSGKPSNKDNVQVKEYVDLLNQMGYQTDGYLLYIKEKKIVSV